MSYRNDHDAAVARVDALQHEVARLAAENDKLRAPGPVAAPARKPRLGLGLVTILGGGAVAAITGLMLGLAATASGAPHEAPAPQPLIAGNERAAVPDGPMSLADCANAIAPRPVADPRKPLDVAALERTSASCRTALRELARGDVPGDDSVTRWSNAEDRLANRISLLVVYYSSDPAALDSYTAAPRLWTEYDEARSARDAALDVWRARY
jgi:hypothetical protein